MRLKGKEHNVKWHFLIVPGKGEKAGELDFDHLQEKGLPGKFV